MSFTAKLGIGGGGTPISEFCALVDIITKRHGKDVMISECDKKGHMHFSKKVTGVLIDLGSHLSEDAAYIIYKIACNGVD